MLLPLLFTVMYIPNYDRPACCAFAKHWLNFLPLLDECSFSCFFKNEFSGVFFFLLIISEDLQKSPVLERLKTYFHDTLKDYNSPLKCIFCLHSERKMRENVTFQCKEKRKKKRRKPNPLFPLLFLPIFCTALEHCQFR